MQRCAYMHSYNDQGCCLLKSESEIIKHSYLRKALPKEGSLHDSKLRLYRTPSYAYAFIVRAWEELYVKFELTNVSFFFFKWR